MIDSLNPFRTWSTCHLVAWPAAALLLVVAACAAPAGPSGPDPGVVSSGPLPPPSGPPGASSSPNPLVPEPAEDLHRERWTRVVPVAGSRQVRVSGTLTGGPPCAVLGRIDVEEKGQQVTVTVWVGRRAGADCSGAQPAVGYPYVTTVTLRAPLGQRAVVDGAA